MAQIDSPTIYHMIAQLLNNAGLVMIGKEKAFVNVGKYQDIYTLDRCRSGKTKIKQNELMDVDAIIDGYIRYCSEDRGSLLEKVLKACSLTPLPQLTTQNELKKRIKIKNNIKS